MKTCKLLLSLFVGVLALLGMLTLLNPDKAAADVHRGWEGGWYWKDGGWTDYAINGVPDFDQRQDNWGYTDTLGIWHWTYCGPVAAANSLWWFDSKFETSTVPPPAITDTYRLITSSNPSWDDHDPQNVQSVVNELAWYFDTDGIRTGRAITGTDVYSLATGLQQYITNRGLADRYYVSIRGGPVFGPEPPLDMAWVYTEVLKSEDVILLLGFYEEQPPTSGHWVRIGGHFVTAVGVTQTVSGTGVALSDPIQDRAETVPGGGRVGNGSLIPHILPHTGVYTIHNDAGNVSHDIYWALPGSQTPGSLWYLPDYMPDDPANFQGVNPHPDPTIPTGPYLLSGPIHTEIEYAVAVSPMFWKTSYDDYAPSGVPDFDMKQDQWGYTDTLEAWHWTHDGPTVWANSFWWFDAKFNDEITRSVILDVDHISTTVPSLIASLANYAGTNQGLSGTSPISLSYGIDRYLSERGLQNYFYRTTYETPPFDWVVHEVEKSEDVLLLLGFWQQSPDGTQWSRIGGHWVTVAGINGRDHTIAFSDPYLNWAEEPMGQGRVLPFLEHPMHWSDYTLHNDALYVSHDVWVITDTQSPGGRWGPVNYTVDWNNFLGVNPHPSFPFGVYSDTLPVVTEVEYAVAVSPMEMFWKGAEGYEDYAPNGIPDLDQKQDCWGTGGGPCPPIPPARWTYCGPVAAANSLWWFDSKFEPDPQNPLLGPSDHFPLVGPYGPWDDHDPQNVRGGPPGSVPVPPGLVEELAFWMDTDGQRTGTLHWGTTAVDMEWGINAYLQAHGMASQFYTKTVQRPSFEYVCDQVEQSEDVVLLIGFWQYQGVNTWLRWGGHYVTVAGVDRTYRHIAFSDPYRDAAENLWSGRVLSGTLLPHYPPHPSIPDPTVHNDAGNISHDIYQITNTLSPGGVWGPIEYSSIYPYFEEQNDGMRIETGQPGELGVVVAEVEWAFVVSPEPPDVTISKEVTPTLVVPGDWITFTLVYTNAAANWAENVVISDLLPSTLVSSSWSYTTTYGGPITASDTYTWTVGRLRYMEGGVITITARVNPNLAWPAATTVITNLVEITTTTPERTPDLPNSDFVTLTVQTVDLEIAKSSRPSTLTVGAWLTYTLVYTNNGPATAANAVITDLLDSWLTGASYTYTNNYGAAITDSDTYVWQVGTIPGGGRGIVTVTARVSPTLSGGGLITNTAYITGLNATGGPTPDRLLSNNTATATITILNLAVTKQAQPDPAQAGATLTYTIRITNTGGGDLHADITDTLPLSVTPSGVLTWTNQLITAPVGVWTTQFTITVDVSHTGTLTNMVQVTTDEGATGVYTHTTGKGGKIYMPIIMKSYR